MRERALFNTTAKTCASGDRETCGSYTQVRRESIQVFGILSIQISVGSPSSRLPPLR